MMCAGLEGVASADERQVIDVENVVPTSVIEGGIAQTAEGADEALTPMARSRTQLW